MTGLVTLGETMGLVSCGPLAHATTARVGVGGAESNVAVGVQRLGVPATWVGRVGCDAWGARVLRELHAERVDVVAVEDASAPTGLMTKERIGPRTRVIYHRRGSAGSRLAPSDVPVDLVERAGVLHLTGITPGLSATAAAAVDRAVDTATRAGVPVSFDVNHRDGVWSGRDPAPTYRRLAAAASVVFAGPEECRLVTGSTSRDPGALLAALASITGGDAVLKLGADGAMATVSGVVHEREAVAVEVVDTVGAGDAFVAAYLAGVLRSLPVGGRLDDAVAAGALACTGEGDWESLPRRADLDGLLAAHRGTGGGLDEPVLR